MQSKETTLRGIARKLQTADTIEAMGDVLRDLDADEMEVLLNLPVSQVGPVLFNVANDKH